jgi:tetratricopeptide (TPR) repeat protein
MEHCERAGRSWTRANDTASRLEQQALSLHTAGRLAEAEASGIQAVRQAREAGPEDRARLLATLAAIRLDRGNAHAAATDSRRACQILAACPPPGADNATDVQRVRVLRLLARSLFASREFAEARRVLEEALGYCHRCLPPDSEEICMVWTLLGSLCWHARELDEAEQHYRRALALAERIWDPFSGEVAAICHLLALLADGWEDGDRMRPHAERACEIRCSLFGSTHPLSAAAQAGWALTLEAADPKRAGEKFLYAISIFDRHYAATSYERSILPETLRDYAICRAGAVRYLLACGRGADACEFSARALEVFREVLGKEHSWTRGVKKEHASLLRATRRLRLSPLLASAWDWCRGFSFSR